MKKHFFFDMDGTLTESRQSMKGGISGGGMTGAWEKLCESEDVVVVSGAERRQIQNQIPDGRYFMLAQNGNAAYGPGGSTLWENKLPWDLKFWIYKWIHGTLEYSCEYADILTWPIGREQMQDLVEDRGCQISYSLIGHHADAGIKRAFDPDQAKRNLMLKNFPWMETRVEVKIGGTTCLDFFLDGHNKGFNIMAFITRMGWSVDECVYVGDALFPGGNDESVFGVIDVVKVSNPQDTELIIRGII